jgi:preprotein translocase subunit SecE
MERADRAPNGFLWGVRQELEKVDWPTRHELTTYTTVVLAAVGTMTAFVSVLDTAFAKAVVSLLS